MLFLSNPGSMANVFLLSNRFLPRLSNNNIPPFPFLFALSFPVFLFHFLFFFETKKFLSLETMSISIDFVEVVPRVVYFIYLLEGYWKPDTA